MLELLGRIIGAVTVTIVLYPVALNSPTIYIGVGAGCFWLACILAIMPPGD